MRVSVIIPTYNEERTIVKCLVSLTRQSLKDFEVIVVDDGSIDKTRQQLRSFGGQASYKLQIFTQKHEGAGMARNLGARHARGEILVFVDADMTFEDDFLEKLIELIVKGKERGTNSHSEEVGNWDNVWARCWNYNENKGKKMQKREEKTDRVFRAILKSEFDRVGGFAKGGYRDDYSLSRKLGYEAMVTRAKFYHDNPGTLREVFAQARWVGKRDYKLGWVGMVFALLRVSWPITKLVGVYKAIKYRTPAFFLFKIVYNSGMSIGIMEYHILGKGAK